jgi:hypothetical protein
MGIRVVDPHSKNDVVYHWGKYSFKSPLFLWDFYKGQLTYKMAIWPYTGFVGAYSRAKRSIYADKLALTTKQKIALYKKLRWNAYPKNRAFAYQYWYKNCATIPRDYIDEVLGGVVKEDYAARRSGETFRDYVQNYVGMFAGVDVITDVITNHRLDREISEWESMFLPMNIRENLRKMDAVDDEGNLIAGVPLISKGKNVAEFPIKVRKRNDYQLLAVLLAGPLGLGVFMLLLNFRNPDPVRKKAGLRLVGASAVGYGLLSGSFGSVLILNWVFSGHPDVFANANLLLMWPIDFAYVALGYRLFKGAEQVPDRLFIPNGFKFLFLLHALAVIVLAFSWRQGIILQSVNRTLLLFGGLNISLGIVLASQCFRRFTQEEIVKTEKNDLLEQQASTVDLT